MEIRYKRQEDLNDLVKIPPNEMTVAELIYILQNCFLPLDKVEMTCIATEYGHAKLVVEGKTVMEYEN